ncbi:hypothetical protein BLA23254_06479 [Burkholderia lata]|uniref:Lipoprotein n=1 Tax=Burkholderia lata (strain ATCC 17760 / DSM 23089 / LMG 22485 / NCIMB 9086 / R18194 / 383) TaxID=482957 RepID=A0A6P2RP24_BURL3|nr:hypothetical protein [Burkholderia lata]VWC33247.1 hypothetical protein BLA23254_06479 [Burkholderia lata]
MRTIWNTIAVPLVAVVCGTSAHACQPAYRHTEYFGESTYLSEEIRDKVLDDIRVNHYTVIEPQIGLLFYPIVRKGNAIYLGNQPIATEKDSFWYLGHGYYQLNGQLYYMGERVGAYPTGGTVVVHEENRTKPRPSDDPPGRRYCYVSKHANILETSTGLRIEQIVDDN